MQQATLQTILSVLLGLYRHYVKHSFGGFAPFVFVLVVEILVIWPSLCWHDKLVQAGMDSEQAGKRTSLLAFPSFIAGLLFCGYFFLNA